MIEQHPIWVRAASSNFRYSVNYFSSPALAASLQEQPQQKWREDREFVEQHGILFPSPGPNEEISTDPDNPPLGE